MQPDPMKPLPKPAAETHSEGAQKRRQRSRRSRFSRDANHLMPDLLNVRYGSEADKVTSLRHVRFTPNNGRWTALPSQHLAL